MKNINYFISFKNVKKINTILSKTPVMSYFKKIFFIKSHIFLVIINYEAKVVIF